MTATCHDHGPHPLPEPHGPWWLTVRIPLPRTGRHIYIGVTTGRDRFRGFPWWLRVKLARGYLRKPRRPDLLWSLHRWCAHVDVRYDECTCGYPGLTYDGPHEDCAIHGRES